MNHYIDSRMTTLNFHAYGFHKDCIIMPLNGIFHLKYYDKWYRSPNDSGEDEIIMQFDPISIKLDNGESYYLRYLSVPLENDKDRVIRTRKSLLEDWTILGKMPEFKTPDEALEILIKFLKDRLVQ